MKTIINLIKNFFVPKPLPLGRWRLKHNEKECHNYIINIHADPGYPSHLKPEWLDRLNK